LGKPTNPTIGTTSGELLEEREVVNGQGLTSMTHDASDKGFLLREDWDNTQALQHGHEDRKPK
jgi:hypothetical protein